MRMYVNNRRNDCFVKALPLVFLLYFVSEQLRSVLNSLIDTIVSFLFVGVTRWDNSVLCV
jgi:hypothetical protein